MRNLELQLELPTGNVAELIARTRATALIPFESETAGLTEAERTAVAQAFLAGARDNHERLAAAQREAFAQRGWPFRWFQQWRPATAADVALSDTIEVALDVVDQYYGPIFARGLVQPEDMGVLQSKGRGASEGIQAKREAYGQNILISIYCVTGPTNFDPSTGEVEFEPGAKSRILHLLYRELPSAGRLAGDVAAFPIITAPANRDLSVKCGIWMSEGWLGNYKSRPRLHIPWDKMMKAPA
jgi:hypothetical protein